MAHRVALLSTTSLPKFLGSDNSAEEGMFGEDDLLIEAFAEAGIEARRIAWRRTDIDWPSYDAVVIRSTWDYIDDLDGFLATLDAIEQSGCRLFNPSASVIWNYDKRYLLTLADNSLPVVPTHVVERPDDLVAARQPLEAFGQGLVVKPAIGVGGFGVTRFSSAEDAAETISAVRSGAIYLAQPFLPSIQTEGEWSFIYLNRRFRYATLKRPTPGDFRVQLVYGAQTRAVTPDPADVAVADRVMAALPVTAHYARIDMARLPAGKLALMEAELIEPQLFFSLVPGSAAMFARTIRSKL